MYIVRVVSMDARIYLCIGLMLLDDELPGVVLGRGIVLVAPVPRSAIVVFVIPTVSDVVLVISVAVSFVVLGVAVVMLELVVVELKLTEDEMIIHGVVPLVSGIVVSVSLLSSIYPLCKHPAKTTTNIITFADNISLFFREY